MRSETYYVRMTTPIAERRTWVPELTFAARLALVRHQMGWNIKEAALACGQPPQSWRGWEIQGRLPQDIVSVAQAISDRTGVDRDWLLFGGPLERATTPRPRRRRGATTLYRPADRNAVSRPGNYRDDLRRPGIRHQPIAA